MSVFLSWFLHIYRTLCSLHNSLTITSWPSRSTSQAVLKNVASHSCPVTHEARLRSGCGTSYCMFNYEYIGFCSTKDGCRSRNSSFNFQQKRQEQYYLGFRPQKWWVRGQRMPPTLTLALCSHCAIFLDHDHFLPVPIDRDNQAWFLRRTKKIVYK